MIQHPRIHRFPWGTTEHAQVLIVHYGSKSTPMIAQQLRQIGLQSRVIHAHEMPAVLRSDYRPRLVILSGGEDSVFNPTAPSIDEADLARLRQGSVILGICYGAQLLAQRLGGRVATARTPEFGEVQVETLTPFGEYRGGMAVMNHNDEIVELPPGWQVVARTAHCRYALVGNAGTYAVQFHPEVDHTEHGEALLAHLAYDMAGCEPDYTYDLDAYVAACVAWLRQTVPAGDVELGLSGGGRFCRRLQAGPACLRPVVAGHLRRYRLHAGRRTRRGARLVRHRRRHVPRRPGGLPGTYRSPPLLGFRAGTRGSLLRPGAPRGGGCFIDVFVRHARQQGRTPVALVQGTNYADIIESITQLKAHHNVGGLPARLEVQVVEPLAGLFKFEIRQLAAHLGLPEEVVYRQPSPGPGLSIRMWGPVTRAKTKALRQATRILEELMRRHYPDPRQRPAQYYVALAPLASCGLMGDDRVYGYAWVLSGVVTRERESYVTVGAFEFSSAFLREAAVRLINEVTMDDGTRFVRVFVEITCKPPSTTEPH